MYRWKSLSDSFRRWSAATWIWMRRWPPLSKVYPATNYDGDDCDGDSDSDGEDDEDDGGRDRLLCSSLICNWASSLPINYNRPSWIRRMRIMMVMMVMVVVMMVMVMVTRMNIISLNMIMQLMRMMVMVDNHTMLMILMTIWVLKGVACSVFVENLFVYLWHRFTCESSRQKWKMTTVDKCVCRLAMDCEGIQLSARSQHTCVFMYIGVFV